MCGAAGGLASACLGVPLAVARAALLAAGPAAAGVNRPRGDRAADGDSIASTAGGGGWLELRAALLAGGPTGELGRDAVHGLATLYDEPYSHATDAAALRAAAAAAGCTHVVVAAGRAGEAEGALKVAAAGAVAAALGGTVGKETRVSHGTHWYCWEGKSLGFAPNGDIQLNSADASHRDDPLRLSWHLTRGGGWRAGDVCDLYGSGEWRKLVWGFRL